MRSLSRSCCFRFPRRKQAFRLPCAIIFVFIVLFLGGLLYYASYRIHKYATCSDYTSELYLKELCRNYTSGIITGSLCRPLCDTMEIKFRKCLGHGVKLHVFEADWKGVAVILKAKNTLGTHAAVQHADASVPPWMKHEEYKMTRKEFIERANMSLFYNLAGEKHSDRTIEVVEKIFSECDLAGDGVLKYEEMITCWELVETTEYVLNLMLRGTSPALDIYGACGNMYALQYAASQPFLGYKLSLSDGRSWSFRVRLAIALLDMVEALEETPYGTLHLCDSQEANFGLVKKPNGDLVAKAIDVDICFFSSSLIKAVQTMKNTTCSKDNDCSYFTCSVQCDTSVGKCTGIAISNNLSQLCDQVFLVKHIYHPALLREPPESIAEQLNALLNQCAQHNSIHIDRELLLELKYFLLANVNLRIQNDS